MADELNTGYNPTAEQQQNMDNLSFDRKYLVNAVEVLSENEAGTAIVRNKPLATSDKQDTILTELQQKTEPTDIQLGELIPLFRALLMAIANPSYVDKSANQMRSQVTGTLTTVTTLTNVGSFTGDHLQRQANITAWATNIRSLIT